MIMPCKCKHKAQDELHGIGNRVWNWGTKIGTTGGWRCTVCGATKAGKQETTAEVKK